MTTQKKNLEQYYEILGLKLGATWTEVKQAYRDMAMVWHPDRFENSRLKLKAQEELKVINQAYEVLKSYQSISEYQTSSSNTAASGSANSKTYKQNASTKTETKTTIDDIEKCYKQGIDKAQKGRYEEAIQEFNQVLYTNPNYIEALKYRGIAYSKIGDSKRAIKDLKKAAEFYEQQSQLYNCQEVVGYICKLLFPY